MCYKFTATSQIHFLIHHARKKKKIVIRPAAETGQIVYRLFLREKKIRIFEVLNFPTSVA